MVADQSKWIWAVESALRNELDGGIVRFFKAEGVKQPGVLAAGAPPDATTLFAREAIQNSWDAAREWMYKNRVQKREIPPFWIDIKFCELLGDEKAKFVSAAGIGEHSLHLGSGKQRSEVRRKVGLYDDDCLESLSDPTKPLRILKFIEHSSLGMPGEFIAMESRMYHAMLSVGYTMKRDGSGGSYGYGKAGLISASKIRVIWAYSSFDEEPNDPDVTRRLMGATYWSHHEYDSKKCTGWGRLGKATDGSAVPLENEDADAAALALGLDLRDPDVLEQKGTTFLIAEPTITARELKTAIERNWWPAMIEDQNGLRVRITDFDGTVMTPSVPKDDPDLKPFVRAYELATRRQDAKGETEKVVPLGKYQPQGSDEYQLGTLGLIADPSGWSFPDLGDEGAGVVDHCTLVALVRGPRKVIEYNEYRLGMPFVRGCFVADEQIDDLLRQTEPKAHNKWDPLINEAGVNQDAPKIAGQIYSRLREEVKNFKKNFATPPPRSGELNLPILDELSRLMKGKKPIVPQGDARTIRISFIKGAHAVSASKGDIKCISEVEFIVDDWVWDVLDPDVLEVEVTVQLSVAIIEDETIGERLPLNIKFDKKQFVLQSDEKSRYVFIGPMRRGQRSSFKIETDGYSSDWSVKFTPIADVTNPEVPSMPKRTING